jgi:two-component system, NarL family, sensor kinase
MQTTTTELVLFIVVSTCLILLMGTFILMILFLARKKNLKNERLLQELKNEFEKDILQAQIEIQEQTFEEISREIHDNINLSLTLAKLRLNTIGTKLPELDDPIDLIGKAINELSDLSRSMNSDIIKDCGLLTALTLEVERIKKLQSITIILEIHGVPVFLESQRELYIFRILQEALHNTLKHAKAKSVLIKLDYSQSQLKIEIKDDGQGLTRNFKYRKTGSFPSAGFRNMQKRIELLQGNFSIFSEQGKGTKLLLSLPITNVA